MAKNELHHATIAGNLRVTPTVNYFTCNQDLLRLGCIFSYIIIVVQAISVCLANSFSVCKKVFFVTG